MQIMRHPLCINPHGLYIEDVLARWQVLENGCTLLDFEIGDWTGNRDVAVQMTGEDHVRRQEAIVWRLLQEREREERISLRSDNATFIAGE